MEFIEREREHVLQGQKSKRFWKSMNIIGINPSLLLYLMSEIICASGFKEITEYFSDEKVHNLLRETYGAVYLTTR